MTASTMRDLLLEKYGEYIVVFRWEMSLSDMFGEGYLLGDADDSKLSVHSYACIYSDTKERDNPFIEEKPDAIYVLEDDGRCIFMYEME